MGLNLLNSLWNVNISVNIQYQLTAKYYSVVEGKESGELINITCMSLNYTSLPVFCMLAGERTESVRRAALDQWMRCGIVGLKDRLCPMQQRVMVWGKLS